MVARCVGMNDATPVATGGAIHPILENYRDAPGVTRFLPAEYGPGHLPRWHQVAVASRSMPPAAPRLSGACRSAGCQSGQTPPRRSGRVLREGTWRAVAMGWYRSTAGDCPRTGRFRDPVERIIAVIFPVALPPCPGSFYVGYAYLPCCRCLRVWSLSVWGVPPPDRLIRYLRSRGIRPFWAPFPSLVRAGVCRVFAAGIVFRRSVGLRKIGPDLPERGLLTQQNVAGTNSLADAGR